MSIWYAVQKETTDPWDNGSEDYFEAVEMLVEQGSGLIAVIEDDYCVSEEYYEELTRVCPVCGKTAPKIEMEWTYDCHGIPFRLVCCDCYEKSMEDKGYDGEYYTEFDECIDYDY